MLLWYCFFIGMLNVPAAWRFLAEAGKSLQTLGSWGDGARLRVEERVKSPWGGEAALLWGS